MLLLQNSLSESLWELMAPYSIKQSHEALMISGEGSHLKQGSRPAIFIVIIDDRVPSRARLFLFWSCLVPPKKTLFLHLHWNGGSIRTSFAMVASLWNRLNPVTYEEWTKNTVEISSKVLLSFLLSSFFLWKVSIGWCIINIVY